MSINLTITADSAEELRSQVTGLSAIMQQESFTGSAGTSSSEETPPATRTRQRKAVETDKVTTSGLTGTNCSICKKPQSYTSSGVTCPNGHGGVPAEDELDIDKISKEIEEEANAKVGAVVTIEELRAKVAAVAQSGKQPQVKALLTEFGSESVSKLPEDQRAAFIKALEKL